MICFGAGREHKVNLLRGLLPARGSKWMSGSARKQEPPAERQTCTAIDPDQTNSALSAAHPEISRLFLTSDLHGWRFIAH
jgi:hypothetical protein